MTTDRDTSRIVRWWLQEGVTGLPDRVLDAVAAQLPETRQRRTAWPAWLFGGARAGTFSPLAASLVLLVVLALATVPILGPWAAPGSTPSPSPTPGVTAIPTQEELFPTPLPPGSYSLAGFPVGISFTLPGSWTWCSNGTLEQAVCRLAGQGQLAFLVVDNVVADPCTHDLLDPPVGPSVDDLVSAISSLPGFEATHRVDVAVDGFRGKQFTLTAPNDPECLDLRTWATAERINGVGAGEANVIRIIDVGGHRIVVTAAYAQLETDADQAVAEMAQVMDSVTFTLRP